MGGGPSSGGQKKEPRKDSGIGSPLAGLPGSFGGPVPPQDEDMEGRIRRLRREVEEVWEMASPLHDLNGQENEEGEEGEG